MPSVPAIPFAAALISAAFASLVLRQYLIRRRLHQLAWGGALAMFAAAALIEAIAGVWGWSVTAYRLYYLLGGLLDVGWLGAGTLLLLSRPAGRGAAIVMAVLTVVAIPAVIVAPVHTELLGQAEPGRGAMGGLPLVLAPITNVLGSVALIGGALWSAWSAWRHHAPTSLVVGLAVLAGGALVAAAGHGLAGQVAGRHLLAPLGELAGAVLMFTGYLAVEAPQRAAADVRTTV